MAKTALSETQSEETEITSASGDIIEGSPTASLAIAPGAGLVCDFPPNLLMPLGHLPV